MNNKADDTVAVYDLISDKQVNSLLFKTLFERQQTIESWQQSTHATDSCFVNEQLAYKLAINQPQMLQLKQGQVRYQCQVAGIYYDYGNQGYGVKIQHQSATVILTGWKETGFSLFINDNSPLTKDSVIEALQLDDEQVYSPEQIKALALDIFEQTFVLTQAIAFVLLAIACFGLFLSANSLELARKPDLHILSSLGYSQKELFHHMLCQWALLALATVVISWPVASILANALVSQVLPVSFGWSMPLHLDIAAFATTSIIGLLILLPALGIPLYKLNLRESLS